MTWEAFVSTLTAVGDLSDESIKKKKTQDGDCEPRWYRGVWLRWRWLILVQMEISEEQVYGGKDCIWFDDQVVHTQEYPWGEEIHVSIMHAVKCYRPLEHWALKCINSVLTHAAAAAAAKWSQSRLTLCDPTDSSPPGSLSLGFSSQEYWNGLPFPSPTHESEK